MTRRRNQPHVIVTGASSYIAQKIIECLARNGAHVYATSRRKDEKPRGANEIVQLDLCEPKHFLRLPSIVDAVVHVAAATPRHTTSEIVSASAAGTINVRDYAIQARARRLVFMSSLAVHGLVEHHIVNERTPVFDTDVYGAAKYLAERIFAARSAELPSIALRLPGVLGNTTARSWLPNIVQKLMISEDVELYNPKAAFNNVIDVSALAEFVCSLVLNDNWDGFHAFPVAASGAVPISRLVDEMKYLLRSRSIVRVLPSKKSSYTVSSNYAIKRFGYSPIDILETVHRFIKVIK